MSRAIVDCKTCTNNLTRKINGSDVGYCSKRIHVYPHAKIYCTGYHEVKGVDDVAARVKQKRALPPAKKEPSFTDKVHLKQYVDQKKKDTLFYYIFLPEC
jgi:hypothetical protein